MDLPPDYLTPKDRSVEEQVKALSARRAYIASDHLIGLLSMKFPKVDTATLNHIGGLELVRMGLVMLGTLQIHDALGNVDSFPAMKEKLSDPVLALIAKIIEDDRQAQITRN